METKDIIQIAALAGVFGALLISATIGFKDATTGVMCTTGFLTILGVPVASKIINDSA